IRGVSIGFTAVADAIEWLPGGGRRFKQSEILELSLVTVPANAAATLAIVKSIDQAARGHSSAPVRGPLAGHRPMTTTEHRTQLENTRADKAARLADLMKPPG